MKSYAPSFTLRMETERLNLILQLLRFYLIFLLRRRAEARHGLHHSACISSKSLWSSSLAFLRQRTDEWDFYMEFELYFNMLDAFYQHNIFYIIEGRLLHHCFQSLSVQEKSKQRCLRKRHSTSRIYEIVFVAYLIVF